MHKEPAFDFDQVITRQGSGCKKWDAVEGLFGAPDVLPLWIADMDFSVPPAVTAALQQRLQHPVYGYNTYEPALYDAIIAWLQRRHQWTVEKDWLLFAPGVVPSIVLSILTFSEPGEGVIIQPPVYPPFFTSIKENSRKIVENPLLLKDGRYVIDFADLEHKLAHSNNKILLLCSPHNPVGRVWEREELERICQLCSRYGVQLLVDEIHHDLILPGRRHTVLATLEEPAARQAITFAAASKTFNIAGLNSSFIVASCPERRRLLAEALERFHIGRNNLFGCLATEAAYRDGEAWLDAVCRYLDSNAALLLAFVKERLPQVSVTAPEGTYLAWLDFRQCLPDSRELELFLAREAKVGLNPGRSFGTQGQGFARLNFAAPRRVLLEGLERIEQALAKRC